MRRLERAGDRRALVLLGARQVGKTTIFHQCIEELLQRGVPPRSITYFDAADRRITESFDLDEIVAANRAAESSERFIFVDEIGSAVGWDRWLKQAVDGEIGRVLVTDSSASLLRAGGRESGAGRWDEFLLEGLVFSEFLRLQGRGSEPHDDPQRGLPLGSLVERYLQAGGFPEHAAPASAVGFAEIRERLRIDIADRAIRRDLQSHGIDTDRVRRLFVYLVEDSGAILNVSKRASALNAERPTVDRWLTLLEDTYLVSPLRATHQRPSARLKARRRIYAADHGLVHAFGTRGDPKLPGRVFEAVVFRHLRELAREQDGSLSFYRRNKQEVDFVLEVGTRRTAIEVTSSTRVRADKIRRFIDAADATSANHRILIYGGPPQPAERDVTVLPLPVFLQDPHEALSGASL